MVKRQLFMNTKNIVKKYTKYLDIANRRSIIKGKL